ncbi:SDR family oxidoreductase [Sulfitobacter noctilucae]|uniref:SDR family oxidoreductase n=1 Tax=Sulfitobacter noctilucae TaxID=1342302 RepID=UPI00046A3252|nr:SDR family oxidoreductase [Sulfitobacter noctilucae]
MNVLVAGSTGKTGRQLVADIAQMGHTPVALVRDGSDTSVLPKGTAQRKGDLTNLTDDICADMDVVVFAAGSGGDTGSDMTDKVDRDGAMRLTDIAAKAGVSRFVMLSSVGADASNPEGDLAHYLKAKHDADEHLKASGLSYAILRPVALTDDGRSDGIKLGSDVDKSAKASRADVAAVLADAAVNGTYDGKALDMQSA